MDFSESETDTTSQSSAGPVRKLRKRECKFNVQDDIFYEAEEELVEKYDTDEDFIPKKEKSQSAKPKKVKNSSSKSVSLGSKSSSNLLSKVTMSPSAMFSEAEGSNSVVVGKSLCSLGVSENGTKADSGQNRKESAQFKLKNVEALTYDEAGQNVNKSREVFSVANYCSQAFPEEETEILATDLSKPRTKKLKVDKWIISEADNEASSKQGLSEPSADNATNEVSGQSTSKDLKPPTILKSLHPQDCESKFINVSSDLNKECINDVNSNVANEQFTVVTPEDILNSDMDQDGMNTDKTVVQVDKHAGNLDILTNKKNNASSQPRPTSNVNITGNDDRRITCSQCGKTFNNKSGLLRHETSHSGIRFSCEECTKSFKRKDLLNYHKKKTHMGTTDVGSKDANNIELENVDAAAPTEMDNTDGTEHIESDNGSPHSQEAADDNTGISPSRGLVRNETVSFQQLPAAGPSVLIRGKVPGIQRQSAPRLRGKFRGQGRQFKGHSLGPGPRPPITRPAHALRYRPMLAPKSTSIIPVIDLEGPSECQQFRPRGIYPPKNMSDQYLYPVARETVPFPRRGWSPPPGLSITRPKAASSNMDSPSLSLPCLAKCLSQLGEEDGTKRIVKYHLTEAQVEAFQILGFEDKLSNL